MKLKFKVNTKRLQYVAILLLFAVVSGICGVKFLKIAGRGRTFFEIFICAFVGVGCLWFTGMSAYLAAIICTGRRRRKRRK